MGEQKTSIIQCGMADVFTVVSRSAKLVNLCVKFCDTTDDELDNQDNPACAADAGDADQPPFKPY
jgi:hypothetical protein